MTFIVGTRVNSTTYSDATEAVVDWSHRRDSRYVCIANVHMLMEASDSNEFKRLVNAADLIVPDGMPLVWILRVKGKRSQQRVYGPTLMLYVMEFAARDGIPVGFYGGKPEVLESLTKRMQARYSKLSVVFSVSPPFHVMSPEEDASIVEQINESGARILFVGLGCPKQELWMAEHRGRVKAVMLGVGAAFDFHAGVKPQAPEWIQKIGLEWLFRFFHEPRRLWKRYLYHNPRFIVLALADIFGLLKN